MNEQKQFYSAILSFAGASKVEPLRNQVPSGRLKHFIDLPARGVIYRWRGDHQTSLIRDSFFKNSIFTNCATLFK